MPLRVNNIKIALWPLALVVYLQSIIFQITSHFLVNRQGELLSRLLLTSYVF